MKTRFVTLLLFSILCLNPVFGQTEKYNDLIMGQWTYDTEEVTYQSTLTIMDDGTFEWYSASKDSEPVTEKGFYTLKGNQVEFMFESGNVQLNDIEVLDEHHFQFRYIENVYYFKR